MRSARTLVIALLGAACWRDPAGVYPLPDEAASLNLVVHLVEAGDSVPGWFRAGVWVPPSVAPALGALVVSGTLRPGRIGGRTRQVADRSITVAGVRLVGRVRGDQVDFGDILALPADPTQSAVVLPGVTGIETPPVLAVARIGRGGEQPAVTPDGLRFALRAPDSLATANNTSHTWMASVSQGQRVLEISGNGLLGGSLALPRWDQVSDPATVRILQRSFATNASPVGTTGYGYYVTMGSSVRWTGITTSARATGDAGLLEPPAVQGGRVP